MPFRLPSLVVACLAMLGSLFVVTAPAEAAQPLSTRTNVVAMSKTGHGSVWARCATKKPCRGQVWVQGAAQAKRSFTLKGRSAGWVTFRHANWQSQSTAVVRMTRAAPQRVQVQARVSHGTISGTIARASGPAASGVKVELWRIGTRNRDVLVSTASGVERNGGRFAFRVRMGANNKPSATYKLHVVGTSGGERRSWWWRGGNGSFAGGARDMGSATRIRVTKAGKFRYVANARYAAIAGQVRNGSRAVRGTEVTIVGRPPYWSRSSRVLRDLDFMACANVYGRTVTNASGRYQVGFLPTSSARIYAVKPESGGLWFGAGDKAWGSCHGLIDNRREARSSTRMLQLPHGGLSNRVQNVGTGRTSVNVAVAGYQGPSSTAKVDRYLTVREYAKGRKILSSDVVRATSGRKLSLGEGYYWFEIGRRTGCHAWYKSRYKNNNGYFNGLDRGFEKWKAKNHRMYRQHCRAWTSGTHKLVYVKGSSQRIVLKNFKGGSVSGRVKASKIKPRTELMVRLTSTNGTNVYRTAMTDGGGNFKITGLASGRYRVVVNADSWRGISRAFAGPKSVKVTRGKNKSVGTLTFKQ